MLATFSGTVGGQLTQVLLYFAYGFLKSNIFCQLLEIIRQTRLVVMLQNTLQNVDHTQAGYC
jgi:hypothetical protein